MDKISKDTIKKIKFFKKNGLEISAIVNVADKAIEISTNDGSYLLKLAEIFPESLGDIKLCDIEGITAKPILESGFLEDIGLSYQISKSDDSLSLEDYLKKSTRDENYKLGHKFGNLLYDLHTVDPKENIAWYNIFNTKANYLFYMHGLSDNIGDRDYVLIDYINQNKHLTKNLKSSYQFENLKASKIIVDKNLDFDLLDINFENIGDPIFDFTHINEIATFSEDFAKGCLDAYFNGKKVPIKFYRLLALYQAYKLLKNMVNRRENKEASLSESKEKELLLMYDYFNEEIPLWVGAVAE